MFDLLYPGRTVVFDSALSVAEVTRRLEKEVSPPRVNPFWDRRQQLFEGTFANGHFHMMRLVHGRQSFRPVLDGQLSPAASGTHVAVRMQLHPLVIAFCTALALIGGMLASVAAPAIPVVGGVPPPLVGLLAIGLVALLVGVFGSIETRTAIRLLEGLLETNVHTPDRVSEQPVPQR